ncbi:MAG: hypothetical protein IJ026_07380 [Candidatus Methanomethylophilaceae archaeon]|nr:hypothetical protein [Candidatus Methanomethylophilaceae archaeon]
MSGFDEEEFQRFVKQNRDLIERMMALQKEAVKGVVTDAASMGRDLTHDAVSLASETTGKMRESADATKEKAEEFARTTYGMFTDPTVQKHFMTMGMEFMMGLSAMMQKAPMPDFMKDAASGMEQNWKQSACRNNDECAARKAKARKVNIDVDTQPETKTGAQEIVVTDARVTE